MDATRVGSNVVWNFSAQVVSFLLTFVTTPFIIYKLGADIYGLLMTVGLVTNYFWFMDLGLGQATVKYVAEYTARQQWDQVSRVFWCSLGSYVILGALAAVVIGMLAPFCVYRIFKVPVALQNEALTIFYLSAVGFLVGMINNAPASIPRALQRFDLVNLIVIAAVFAQSAATICLLSLGYSVVALVAANLVIGTASLTINFTIARRLVPQLNRPRWDLPMLRRLLKFGGFVTISGIVSPILVNIEKVILANRISLSAVAYYTVPFNLTIKLTTIAGAFSSALYPAFSHLEGKREDAATVSLILRASRYVALLTAPWILFFIVFGQEILQVWLGSAFARHYQTLQILAVAMFVNALALSPLALVQSRGRPDVAAKFHLLEIFVHVPSTLICVSRWGLQGAAIAWLMRTVLDTILLWGAAVTMMKFSWKLALGAVMNPGVWAIVVGGVMLSGFKPLLRENLSSSYRLVVAGVALALSTIPIWCWGLSDEERVRVRGFIGSRIVGAQ